MKRTIRRVFNQMLMFGTLIGTLAGIPLLAGSAEEEIPIQKIAVYYQQKRPFSWYYPYRFQFYYPRRGGDSCSWVYTNGAYVYNCN